MGGSFELSLGHVIHWLILNLIVLLHKGVSTCQRRGEGMQLSYSCIEGEMLAITKFKSRNDAI